MIDLDALHARLIELDGLNDLNRDDVLPMKTWGLAHDHVRLSDRGLIVRLPRRTFWDLTPNENIAYQGASFRRAQSSGHVPRLGGTLEPDGVVPFGALVVEEIRGRVPRMPSDLGPIAQALARIHAIPLPPKEERPPLVHSDDPVAWCMNWIDTVTPKIQWNNVDSASQEMIEEELDWARRFKAEVGGVEQPVCLVLTDTHPSNFVIADDGIAIFLDIQSLMYGSPAVDLARASLFMPSISGPKTERESDVFDMVRFYRAYLSEFDDDTAATIRPWFMPMRRLTWLKQVVWQLGWLAGTLEPKGVPVGVDQSMEADFRERLKPAEIIRLRDQWMGENTLESLL